MKIDTKITLIVLCLICLFFLVKLIYVSPKEYVSEIVSSYEENGNLPNLNNNDLNKIKAFYKRLDSILSNSPNHIHMVEQKTYAKNFTKQQKLIEVWFTIDGYDSIGNQIQRYDGSISFELLRKGINSWTIDSVSIEQIE